MKMPSINREVFGGSFERRPQKPQKPLGRGLPSGRELLDRINSGDFAAAPVDYLEAVRHRVSENCEELLEVGARIRPLMAGGRQVGWIRGVHPNERKWLKRWIKEPNDFIANILILATSFTPKEIDEMTSTEVYNLIEIIKMMTQYDMTLWSYLNAFATTQTSENLWFSEGTKVTSYQNKAVTMPDGKKIRVIVPPDHARLWASLCTYREQAKKRLDENWNALLTIRPTAGRSADPLQSELKNVGRQLMTNAIDAWQRIVKPDPKVDVDDGWAHPGDSAAELQREMLRMIKGDRHEKVMEAWQTQMEQQAQKAADDLEARRKKRGHVGVGVVEERTTIYTEKEMREREAAIRKGLPPPKKGPHMDRNAREVVQSPLDRLRKYK
jgi:hypothetical protein